jgi:hypothetical protein
VGCCWAESGLKITVHLIKQAYYRQLPFTARLITGEVKEGLTIDEFGSEQSEIIASFSFSYKEER